MDTLAIDIETYSSADLKKSGLYRYVQAEDFTILLLAYSFNGNPVKCTEFEGILGDPKDTHVGSEWVDILTDPKIKKTAHNANFERVCLNAYFGIESPIDQWECTMVKSAMLGFPLALDQVSKAMGLTEQKSAEGRALIKYFCTPCKPTKTNGERTRNLPEHDPEKWGKFKNYCIQDVVVERAISANIKDFVIPETERRLYILDQQINDRGLLLDDTLARNAIRINAAYIEAITKEAVEITGLDNPNSRAQLIEWLSKEMPLDDITTLKKTDIPELIKSAVGYTGADNITRLLNIRAEMSKTSVKKYNAMINCLGRDKRVRGLIQFCGAGRTWRWAGRLIQIQNLPKNIMSDLDLAREIVKSGDGDLLQLIFGNVPDTLSQLIRTAFVAPEGTTFGVSDFSAIEARVLAWLAGEQWRLDVFNKKGKIYEESASKMFKIPLDQITKGSVYRQKGKMSELALGYQGGANAIINIEISNKTKPEDRIPQEELPELVQAWRKANPAIVKFWYKMEDGALQAMTEGSAVKTYGLPGQGVKQVIRFKYDKTHERLTITLPSGRNLTYVQPRLRPGKFDKDQVTYMGLSDTKQWQRISTYGGKLTENIVQAVARDLLADAMLRLDEAGYCLNMHVHDEIVAEITPGLGHLDKITEIMSTAPDWAAGLPMAADSYETNYYFKKD